MKNAKAPLKVIPVSPVEEENRIAPHVEEILRHLGENPQRDGLLRTPIRVDKALRDLTSGYRTRVSDVLNSALFDVDYDEMVIVKDIEFYSLCEHHMLPFFGKMHVAYIPNGKVIGLSKIPRIVDIFAKRLQVQERLTQEVAQTIMDTINPKGVGVVATAQHFCMMMRGVEKQCSDTITSTMLGCFRNNRETRNEFLSLIRSQS
ncbi:MAG: GTP cyclohydrolase I FolE [Bryobacterales bacterium]|nr:GTP cyclohydrolase I FolE [Bryobacterales bacterium]